MKETEVRSCDINIANVRKELRDHDAELVKKGLQRNVSYGNKYTSHNKIAQRILYETQNGKTLANVNARSGAPILVNQRHRTEHETDVADGNVLAIHTKIIRFHRHASTEIQPEYYKLLRCS